MKVHAVKECNYWKVIFPLHAFYQNERGPRLREIYRRRSFSLVYNKLLNLLNLLNLLSLRIVAINTRFYFADVSICYPLSRGISCSWSFAEDEQTYFDVDPRTRRRGRTVRPVAATFAGLQCI